ncbi:hypothetical protein FB45DRAFT_1053957 [Roridomyces roridus]|uniref:RNase III domain-containing protein n=1 Tax=Roridomyces roridus TaxID=1738132 RepID=A0AAD7C860_9AGAR|nr:hypothetical protein FB45DRAFT_1053957 [Roridomyces roridus]
MGGTPPETVHLPNPLLAEPAGSLVASEPTPEVLMKQLDDVPEWHPIPVNYPPQFPDNYPPEFPTLDTDALYRVYNRRKNKVLDWLGDAAIEAAIYLAMYPTLSACAQPITASMGNLCNALASKSFLSHLPLLYGLQLQLPDARRADKERSPFPNMKRMGDLFEGVVGVSLQRCGYSMTLRWLHSLFQPWVAHAHQREDTPFVSAVDKDLYQKRMRTLAGAPVAPRDERLISLDCLVVEAPLRIALHKGSISAAIGENSWEKLDITRLGLSGDYPHPPPLEALDPVILTAALTDTSYYLHFGEDVKFNEGYRSVGQHLLHLAATVLTVRLAPGSTSAQLDEIRISCTCFPVFALVGLMLNVHRHLRTVREAADSTCWISPAESAAAFCSLAGVTYLQVGWDGFLSWVSDILSPWILAAAAEKFLGDKGAQSRRAHRLKAQEKAAENRKQKKKQSKAALKLNQLQDRKSATDARSRYAGDSPAKSRHMKVRPRSSEC